MSYLYTLFTLRSWTSVGRRSVLIRPAVVAILVLQVAVLAAVWVAAGFVRRAGCNKRASKKGGPKRPGGRVYLHQVAVSTHFDRPNAPNFGHPFTKVMLIYHLWVGDQSISMQCTPYKTSKRSLPRYVVNVSHPKLRYLHIGGQQDRLPK